MVDKRVVTFLAIALSLVGVVLWTTFDSDRTAVGDGSLSARGEDSQEAASRLDDPDRVADSVRERSAITGRDEEGVERTRTVRVVDETFGFGLLAWLTPEGESWIRSTRDGVFHISGDLERSALEVSASGYHPQRVRAGAELGGRIELKPRSTCGVRVVSTEGNPVDSVSVTWRPAEARSSKARPDQDASVTTETGKDGTTSIAAASACHATVAANGHGPRTVYVPVGSTVDVRLSAGTAVLTVVCGDTEQPVAGVRVLIKRQSDRNDVTRTAVSDDTGRIVLAGSEGPLQVELVDRAYWLQDPLPMEWSRRNNVEATYVGGVRGSDTVSQELRLPITCETIDVRLVDADTGLLIRGSVRYGYSTARIRRSGSSYDLVETQECRDGVLRVRALRHDLPRIYEPRIVDGYELVIWPEGYQLENLGLLTSLRQGEGELNESVFTRAKKRSLLVHDAADRPVTSELRVRSDDGGLVYHDAVGTAEGVYGPFDWWGGGLIITRPRPRSGGGGLGGGGGSEIVARVSGEQLAEAEQVSVEVDVPVAAVTVVRAEGRQTRVIVVDHMGGEHDPVSRTKDEIFFRGVPAGPVCVGPPEWAHQLHYRQYYGPGRNSMRASEEETLVVPFDSEWAASKEVQGQIRVVGEGSPELFLIPVYCTTSVPAPMGRAVHWLPVRADGTYSIAQGEPLPKALVVCSIVAGRGHITLNEQSGAAVVLDVIEPGVDCVLNATDVEFVWEGPDLDTPTTVDWRFTGGSYSHPDGSVLASRVYSQGNLYWTDAEPRRFGPFPEGTLELGRARGGVRNQTVSLSGNELTVVPVGP